MKYNCRQYRIPVLGFAILSIMIAGCQTKSTWENFSTASPAGFTQAGEIREYDSDTLFDYINGEADIYLNRGFQKLYVKTYRNETSQREYTVDFYDLGTKAQARNTHKHFQGGHFEPVKDLESSATTDGLAVHMNIDRFFIRIQAVEDVANPSRQELIALAEFLHSAVH